MSERWQDIPGFEGYYQASTQGNIRSVTRFVAHGTYPGNKRMAHGQSLKPELSHKGYYRVTLYKEGKRYVKELHCLIASVFVGPRPDKHHTHHINGDKLNNRPTNLKYVPVVAHTTEHNQGEGCHKAILTEKQVLEIRTLLGQGIFQKDIAKQYGVSRSTIGEIKRGASWRHI